MTQLPPEVEARAADIRKSYGRAVICWDDQGWYARPPMPGDPETAPVAKAAPSLPAMSLSAMSLSAMSLSAMSLSARAARRREMAEAVRGGRDVPLVAAEHGVSSALVCLSCKEHGVEPAKTPTRACRMADEVRSGADPTGVAGKWGVTMDSVRGACLRHGVAWPVRVDRLVVVAALLRGEKGEEVATRHGVHPMTVAKIRACAVAAGIPGIERRRA